MVNCSDVQLLVSIMEMDSEIDDEYISNAAVKEMDKEPAREENDPTSNEAAKEVDKEPAREEEETTKKRRNPPWVDPSWEWGGGKYKIDGRKKFKKNNDKENDPIPPVEETVEKINENDEIPLREEQPIEKDKENDAIRPPNETNGGCSGLGVSELSLEALMDEYNALPPQIPEWFWCIEYVAKFHKDLRSILDLMNMGYPCRNDYGKRINEILSLRILEFMFDDPKGKNIADETQPRIEFDLSSSNVDVLKAILKEIPVLELRRGMPELSKFNVLPFIAHKNKNFPQCALEKMKDLGLLEKNQTSEAAPPPPSMEANDSVLQDNRSAQQVDKDKPRDEEEQVNIGLKERKINNDKVIIIDGSDDEEDEVIVIDNDNNEDVAGVVCSKDGVWLIDDELDHMVKGSSSRVRAEKKVCWKCKKKDKGTLLICSRSDCGLKVHRECMNCEVNVDEFGKFLCPVCWFDRVVEDYEVHLKMENAARKKLVKFLPLLTKASKRLMAQNAGK